MGPAKLTPDEMATYVDNLAVDNDYTLTRLTFKTPSRTHSYRAIFSRGLSRWICTQDDD